MSNFDSDQFVIDFKQSMINKFLGVSTTLLVDHFFKFDLWSLGWLDLGW